MAAVSGALLTGENSIMADVNISFRDVDGLIVHRIFRVYHSPACVYPLLLGRAMSEAEDVGVNRDSLSTPFKYIRFGDHKVPMYHESPVAMQQ